MTTFVYGDKVQDWTVIGNETKTAQGAKAYPCRCKCGTERVIEARKLAACKPKSCRTCRRLDVPVGEHFGKWTVLGPGDVSNRKTQWRVRCQCGQELQVLAANLIRGRSSQCRQCRYTANQTGIPKEFWKNLQRDAKKRGYVFDITPEYAWEIFEEQGRRCALSGLPLKFTYKQKETHDRTASLDRVDNAYGYIKGNVQWLHKHVNLMKYRHNEIHFVAMCLAVADYQRSSDGFRPLYAYNESMELITEIHP